MTREEAKRQIETFFRRLGEHRIPFFENRNPVETRIGDTFVGFEYDDHDQLLSAQALIHRFGREPADRVLDAVFGEASDANTGGGRLVYHSENRAFYLQRDFGDFLGDAVFTTEINRLAQAGFRWSDEIVRRAADRAGS